MKYLIISNQGEIKEQALTKMGLSTKRESSSKIGRFGSGNKYTLAFLLRNKIEFYIYSGTRQIPITTSKDSFGGIDYENILINGKETSFTTDMGPDWVFWYAIREIYCNALDEGDAQLGTFDTEIMGEFTANPVEGRTTYIINITNGFNMDEWNKYFSEDRTPLEVGVDTGGSAFSIFPRLENNVSIYKKGIRCIDINAQKKGLYDFEFENISISESRVVQYDYYIEDYIARALTVISNTSIMENILANCKDQRLLESMAMKRTNFEVTESNPWGLFLANKKIVVEEIAGRYTNIDDINSYYQVPHAICKKIKDGIPNIRILGLDKIVNDNLNMVEISEDQVPKRLTFMVNQCIKEMREHWGYNVNHPVEYFEQPFSNEGSLKLAEADTKNNIIRLNTALQKFGKKEIAMALIEECEHIESKARDETRSFQNQLIRTLVFVMENNSGFFM